MSGELDAGPFDSLTEEELRERFEATDYVADDRTVTTVDLALRLGRPLLVEGPPGSGKTELGKTLAEGFDTELIRLQCYEGLTAENALYEWNYTKQLLAVQADEGTVAGGAATNGDAGAVGERDGGGVADAVSGGDAAGSVFGEEYLLERPLLRALRSSEGRPPVLLIDEIDRADEEFEAFLLELLSDFQVSIPEYGTVSASTPPIVILTSNRTRGLSDALKRRCLYLHVEPPSFETEYEIVRRKVPELDAAVAAEVCSVVERLREESFLKRPGVAETLDWARAVAALRHDDADEPLAPDEIERTIGCLLKEAEDVGRVDAELLERLHDAASAAAERTE
ncbi:MULTISPECIES: MoxR family ATPase [unclassified Halorubrum]|uniref:AAA family ATPase n=1 Tax=unclassified Halorubrum TaxID=2642239 RepID=UPI000B998E25|nr:MULTISPECIES: MoxR family ATPase [unclassified Halorubrum]OYR44348.1 ATPase [Halorubrum sp. Hd13]OYR44484.1 ATPase [Halorubrum sp. Eb13]OYR52564.1 ATPase [Halorubrum sp. Ea8]